MKTPTPKEEANRAVGMTVEVKKIKAMKKLMRKLETNNGLSKAELEELRDLSSSFLYLAVASKYL